MSDYENNHHEDEQFAGNPEIAQAVLAVLQEHAQDREIQVQVSALWDRKGYPQIGPINDPSPYHSEYSAEYRLAVEIVLPRWDDNLKRVLPLVRDELAVRQERRNQEKREQIQREIEQHQAQAAALAEQLKSL